MKLIENHIRKIVKSILNEGVDSSTMIKVFNNHPKDIPAKSFYPKIIPKQYKALYTPGGNWWQNSCASKMSHAMNKSGFKTGGGYKTEVDYEGVPKGTQFNPASQAFKTIFRKHFGEPTFKFSTDGSSAETPAKIKGVKGVYVFTTNAFKDASGHVDAWDGTKSAGGHEYFDRVGVWEFWSQKGLNTKNCGWGNDDVSYKNSNWKCYTNPEVAPALKNAKKCGWGNDLKGYRTSGWKCKR
jgi:hypothetical protein